MSKTNLKNKIQICNVPEIPDIAYSQYQAAAGGDVVGAITSGFEHFLRTLVQMLPGSCSAKILFMYRPAGRNQNSQERLKFYVQLEAADSETASNLDSLLRGSPISCFYSFDIIRKRPNIKQLHASCEIIRRMDYLRPLYSCDVNPKIPRSYCSISSFTPDKDNEYLMLDRVLDRITEPVTISIIVKPVDISLQIQAHTTYMANLADINHWDTDYEEFGSIDYTGSGDHSYLRSQKQMKLLNYQEPLAKDVMQTERQIHKTLLKPHLSFRIEVNAETKSVALLVASTVAEAAFKDGSYRIVSTKKNETISDGSGEAYSQKADTSDCTSSKQVDGDTEPKEYEQLRPLSRSCAVDELLGIFRLPIASSSPLCCRKNTDPPQVDERELIFLGYKEQSLTGNGRPIPLGIHIDALTKHFSNFGLPGQGKTTSNMGLVYQLNPKNIGLMVIECAKTEYRVMKMFKKHKEARFRKLAEKLEVYTPGVEKVSPFRFNPFDVLPGIEIAEHIENLMACFKASIPVSVGSLPALLGEALVKVYEDYPDPNRPPVITDLIAAVDAVLAAKGYSSETRSDMQTAIEVRLGVLAQRTIGSIFQCRHGISIEHLMKVPSVIELNALPEEQACLCVLFLLVCIREYLKINSPPAKGLIYVVLIEEAHVIFGSNNNTPASEEIADTKFSVADLISRMLVELRALGVGIILSDQHPTRLESAASQSVASKLTFKEVYGPDREELGRSMLFGNTEMRDIARLEPGLAYFITEGYFESQLIRTPDLGKQLPLFPPPSNQELLKEICNEKWFQEARTNRITDGLDQLKEHMDRFDDKRKNITDKVKRLLGSFYFLLNEKESEFKRQRLAAIVRSLRALRKEVTWSYRQFKKGPYRRFSYLMDELDSQESDLRAFGESLNRRFEPVIRSGTQNLLGVLDKLIRSCMKLKLKENYHGKKKKK